MDKHQVALILEEIALLLEIKGENPFKTRAYTNVARELEGLEDDLEILAREGRLSAGPRSSSSSWLRWCTAPSRPAAQREPPHGPFRALVFSSRGSGSRSPAYRSWPHRSRPHRGSSGS